MGFLLIIPFFAIRFLLLNRLNPDAVERAAYFAPMQGAERVAYWVYQIATGALLIFALDETIKTAPLMQFCTGAAVYVTGCILLAVSIHDFAKPDQHGMNREGLYRISRNPMYAAYFLFFLGCVLLTQSGLLLVCLICFQIAAHWIVLAEERWCLQQFGEAYRQYMKETGRYI